MKKLVIIFAVLFLIFTSCDTTDPKPPEEKPPGYQEDIPWPSLADSPWPMYRGNPQSTGRSPYQGPTIGIIDRVFEDLFLESSLAIGIDSNLITMGLFYSYGLFSFHILGDTLWKLSEGIDIRENHSNPLIAKDGTIYLTSGFSGKLYSIKSDGTIKWEYKVNNFIRTLGINIGFDGTIYFLASDKNIYAINPNGSLNWKHFHDDFESRSQTVISLSPDGKTLYVPGTSSSIYAFDIENQNIKWSFGDERSFSAPMIDNEGNIYLLTKDQVSSFGRPALFSLNNDGSIRWVFKHNNEQQNENYYYAEGTIDKFGNIYFAFDSLYSVDYSGNLRWKSDLGGYTWTPLVSDVSGNIYVVILKNKSDLIKEIAAFDNQGNIFWNVIITEADLGGFAPAIAYNKLIIPTFKSNNLYIIK